MLVVKPFACNHYGFSQQLLIKIPIKDVVDLVVLMDIVGTVVVEVGLRLTSKQRHEAGNNGEVREPFVRLAAGIKAVFRAVRALQQIFEGVREATTRADATVVQDWLQTRELRDLSLDAKE